MRAGLLIGILLSFAVIHYYEVYKRRQWAGKLQDIAKEISEGNLNRRFVVREREPYADSAYAVNEIIEECQKYLIRMEQMERAEKQLLTGLSHDIKTPLTSLTGYLELMSRSDGENIEQKEYLNISCRKAYELSGYINNLFEWFRLNLKEEEMNLEFTDLNELTREAIINWFPMWEKSHLDYDISISEEEYTAYVDKSAYSRIVNNLIQNVARHSHATRIEIRTIEEQEQIRIEIQDNGVGIPEDKISLIFERLYQCDEYNNNDKGAGLGLAIVKELVENMKGEILVESRQRSGTKFILVFPRRNQG